MIQVQCRGCLSSAVIDCKCPPGHSSGDLGHHAECPMLSPGAQVACPPESDCCQQDHDHDAAANACEQQHEGACSLEDPACAVCRPLILTYLGG